MLIPVIKFLFLLTGVSQGSVKSSSQNTDTLIFNINQQHPNDPFVEIYVEKAVLKLHTKTNLKRVLSKRQTKSKQSESSIAINVFTIPIDNNKHTSSEGQLLTSIKIHKHSKTIEVDVTSLVRQWIDQGISVQKLKLSSSAKSKLSDILHIPSKNVSLLNKRTQKSVDLNPIITYSIREMPIIKRQKRYDSGVERRDCKEGDGYSNCCRFRTQVNFTEIGWRWVKAPQVYDAYYCEGSCPSGHRMENTFTGIKELLHQRYPNKFSAASCVPSAYKPLTILHETEDGMYTFTDFSDMIVQDCKCA